jgi:hypothetical protein
MRKSAFALAAILALGSLSVTSDAFARAGGGGGHSVGNHSVGNHSGRNRSVGRQPGKPVSWQDILNQN